MEFWRWRQLDSADLGILGGSPGLGVEDHQVGGVEDHQGVGWRTTRWMDHLHQLHERPCQEALIPAVSSLRLVDMTTRQTCAHLPSDLQDLLQVGASTLNHKHLGDGGAPPAVAADRGPE